MKKENFITLVLGVVGLLFVGLGMCMCLLPEWDSFNEGIVFGIIGFVVLIIMAVVRRKMLGRDPIKVNIVALGKALFGIFGALVFGLGMCMTMIWDGMMIYGILVGIVGIVLLLCLIPMVKGLK